MKQIAARLASSFFTKLRNLFLAILIASPLAMAAIHEAYKRRGYFAVGGEWFFTAFLLVASLILIESRPVK